MNTPLHRPVTLALMAALLFASCAAPQTSSREDLDGPVYGTPTPTIYHLGTTGGIIHGRDLAKVARVLRRYKTLDAAERALVKSSVSKRLQGLIALEIDRVEVQHRAERAAISRLADPAAVKERLAAFKETIRREATARVIRDLGSLVAVPLKTSDNRSAVAFARLGEKGIEVAADAGEIDLPLASLTDGDRVRVQGRQVAAFLVAQPASIAAER